MAKIGKLFLDFEAGTARFNEPIKRAGRNLQNFGKNAKTTQGRLRGFDSGIKSSIASLKGLFVIGAITGAVAGFSAALRGAAQRLDALAKTSSKLGALGGELKTLQVAGELTGVALEKSNMALQRMTRRVAEAAKDTGEAKAALKELGLSAVALNKLSLEDKFIALSQAFSEVENSADKVRLAMKLFDSEGVDLVNTLALGEDALRDIARELERYGLGTADIAKQTPRVEALNDAWLSAKLAMEGLANEALSKLAPFLEAAAHSTRELLISFRGLVSNADSLAIAIASNLIEGAINPFLQGLAAARGMFTTLTGAGELFAGTTIKAFALVLSGIDTMIGAAEDRINRFITSINENPILSPGFDLPLVDVFGEAREAAAKGVDAIANTLLTGGKEKIAAGLEEALTPAGIQVDEIFRTAVANAGEFFGAILENNRVLQTTKDSTAGVGEEIEKATDSADRFTESLSDGLARATVQGRGFGDVLARVAQDFAASKLSALFTTALEGSGGGGGFLGGLGKALGFRANGGNVSANTPYVVGERGPELFVPGGNGSIVPNHRMPQGGGDVVNLSVNIDARGASTEAVQNMRSLPKMIETHVLAAMSKAKRRRMGGLA